MSNVIPGLYYTKEHEWLRADGAKAVIGITDHAQHSLGDIVFCDAEPAGTAVAAGGNIGAVESVKAASDIYAPVSCVVIDINAAVIDDPALLGADPYENWIVAVEITSLDELENLMDAAAYTAYCKSL